MVSSPMYDRVMTFAAQAEHNAELHSWDSEHKRVIDGFDQAIERVQHFQQHQGFTGKTGEALKAWADQTVARLEAKRSYYMGGIARYVAARQAIAQAAADARRLSGRGGSCGSPLAPLWGWGSGELEGGRHPPSPVLFEAQGERVGARRRGDDDGHLRVLLVDCAGAHVDGGGAAGAGGEVDADEGGVEVGEEPPA